MSESVHVRPVRQPSAQWAAQFLIASELSRRGYLVSFTMGNNTPDADLLVVPRRTDSPFMVDVKGQWSKSTWLVTPKQPRLRLFYILVFLPPTPTGSGRREDDQIFILNQDEANKLVKCHADHHPNDKGKMPGFGWRDALGFKDKWATLPN